MKFLNFSYIFLLFLLCFKKTKLSYITYQFKKSTKEIKNYPEDLLQNDLEIKLEIGTPAQSVDLNLRSESVTFFITSSEVKLPYPTFNEANSKTLIKAFDKPSSFSGKEYKKHIKYMNQ